jgi:hypothetical protein
MNRLGVHPEEAQMSIRDDSTVDLEEEILTEAAHTFFSRRVRLDKEIEAFSRAAGKVRKQMQQMLKAAETLHKVVLEPEKLYEALGVEPKDLLTRKGSVEVSSSLELPFGLTFKRRFVALGKRLYNDLEKETKKYNHGELYRNPKTKLMERTHHYNEMVEWHRELTSQIAAQNENLPSYSLQFAKSLNAELCEKENIMECCPWTPNGYSMDKKLAFKGVPFSWTGLVEVPDLPPLRDVRKRLHRFLKQTYQRNRREIYETLAPR